MKITDEINDNRIRNYLMAWIDNKDKGSVLGHFKGKKSELPQEIVVMSSEGQVACKLDEVKIDRYGNSRAYYRFDGWASRKWFAI